MTFNMKAITASVLFAVAGSSQAEIVNGFPFGGGGSDGELFLSIYRDNASPESMIIDTDISLFQLRDGTVTSWASSAAQTAAIQSFLGTAPLGDFRFNAGGVTSQIDTFTPERNSDEAFFFSSNAAVSTTLLPMDSSGFGTVKSNIGAFITEINNAYDGVLGSLPSFVNDGVAAGLNPGEFGFHQTTNMWADDVGSTLTSLTTEALVQDSLGLWSGFNASADLFGYDLAFDLLGTLDIDTATGFATLTTGDVSAVPVPAAAWLFGSGVVGLVGIARRRKS